MTKGFNSLSNDGTGPDRLYELLPAVHRMRDAERGYPLRDLLRVITEQVDVVEENITQLYEDWFIETASDWAVPYIADLVGYTPVASAGDPLASDAAENRILIPRREVARTIADRRRRGTVSVLEDLAKAVADWPGKATEFYRLLCWTQNLNHQHSHGQRARTLDLHNAERLERIGTPFDPFARTVDVRRVNSHHSQGRYDIPNVGMFIWRLKSLGLTRTSAYCLDAGKNSYTFSPLGNDAPLFARPIPEPSRTHLADERNVPSPIRRRGLDAWKDAYYGEGKSLAIWADWASFTASAPVPASSIIAADLSDWHYVPPNDFIAVDPVLGRFCFPENQLPRRNVRVSYQYGFPAEIGGGEYHRRLSRPAGSTIYTVGERGTYRRLTDALAAWRAGNPPSAVIEITDSGVYVEQIEIALAPGQALQLRAANHCRPVIRLLDWQTDLPDALTVRMSSASRFTLDGIVVTGRSVSVTSEGEHDDASACAARLVIRHCTLVPGWTIGCDCEPESPGKESLELRNIRASVFIEHSILGPIETHEDEVRANPIPMRISDSIIDATTGEREAIIGTSARNAHAVLTLLRCTVFGIIQTHAIELAENCIFNDCVHVARRQIGCMRFCYVPPGCRTPRRYHCQPDLASAAARDRHPGAPAAADAAAALATERVKPRFNAIRYGQPAYCQLTSDVASEIFRGADDAAEMGVFHDLFQPQRMANLAVRLDEYTPAGMDAGVILAS